MHRIALGTAQFGMDYGINNRRGKVPRHEVFQILDKALEFGVDTIDTAHAYCESEKILGDFVKNCGAKFKVISKLPKCKRHQVEEILTASLNRLNASSLYGYLIHDFESYKNDNNIWRELEKLKAIGKIVKIGFSLYYPAEAQHLFDEGLKIDMVQVPFSIFDQRFKSYFSEFKKRRIETYVRSVFLQGLVFKQPKELDNRLLELKANLGRLHSFSEKLKIPIYALCINFVLKDRHIDKAIIGVDNIDNFRQLMQAPDFYSQVDEDDCSFLSSLKVDEEKSIIPFNWS